MRRAPSFAVVLVLFLAIILPQKKVVREKVRAK
jgi:hypothetical protein